MFAALHIGGEDTHVTIMLNADPTPGDLDKMINFKFIFKSIYQREIKLSLFILALKSNLIYI